MENFKNKKVVISGGGSGIGKELINQLYQEGTRDFAVIGRNKQKLVSLESTFPEANFILFSGNVADISDISNFVNEVQNKWETIDLLINNAGVVSAGELTTITDEDIIQQVNINVTGLILMTKKFLPLLKHESATAIINVSSNLALVGMPFYSPYAATKGAVKLFSEALRRELQNEEIHVMTLYPTGTDTPMMKTAGAGTLQSTEMVVSKTLEGLRKNEIDVMLGDMDAIIANRNNPQEFDKKAATMYESLKKGTEKHRAM
ncbi:SDR family NAD(P)-dependent oxidoreductase [Zunongwangia sp. H14]|uniref:SDR family NAD(P)-dependent oxidoreductase n=1 Tax=Zunongwangia sp. H14 TaxID=3240792 RepID=UPI003568BAB7